MSQEPVSLEERARRYLSRMDPAIAGSRGHDVTYRAACVVRIGFDLDEETAYRLLNEWNLRCQPPWSEKDLRRKIRQTDRERSKDPGSIGKLAGKPPEKKQQSNTANRGGGWKARKEVFLTGADDRIGKRPPSIPDVAPPPRRHWPGIRMESAAASASDPAPPDEVTPAQPYARIIAIYGSKRALWDQIVAAERALIIEFRKEHGRACNMPDTVWLDPDVVQELPGTIDGLQVRPEDSGQRAGVRVGWTGREP